MTPTGLQRITRRLRVLPQTARVRVAREQVKRIAVLTREAEALKRELRGLVRAHRPELLAHFARVAGVAPIPVFSGRQERHRLDCGGNRQLNRALHVIAITRGRLDPATRAYLQRKEAEGKSRIEAMRCLKRHLVRHYHRLLLGPAVRANVKETAAPRPPVGSNASIGAELDNPTPPSLLVPYLDISSKIRTYVWWYCPTLDSYGKGEDQL